MVILFKQLYMYTQPWKSIHILYGWSLSHPTWVVSCSTHTEHKSTPMLHPFLSLKTPNVGVFVLDPLSHTPSMKHIHVGCVSSSGPFFWCNEVSPPRSHF